MATSTSFPTPLPMGPPPAPSPSSSQTPEARKSAKMKRRNKAPIRAPTQQSGLSAIHVTPLNPRGKPIEKSARASAPSTKSTGSGRKPRAPVPSKPQFTPSAIKVTELSGNGTAPSPQSNSSPANSSSLGGKPQPVTATTPSISSSERTGLGGRPYQLVSDGATSTPSTSASVKVSLKGTPFTPANNSVASTPPTAPSIGGNQPALVGKGVTSTSPSASASARLGLGGAPLSSSLSKRTTRAASKLARLTKPSSPARVTPTSPQLDIDLLRAKIVLECREFVPEDIYNQTLRKRWDALRKPWTTERTEAASNYGHRKQFYVLDGKTWELKQYGTDWEAIAVAGNPGIDAGNGVQVFVKDRAWHFIMRAFDYRQRKLSRNFNVNKNAHMYLPPVQTPAVIRAEQRLDMSRCKEKAGLPPTTKDASPLYFFVCGKIAKIKAGKAGKV